MWPSDRFGDIMKRWPSALAGRRKECTHPEHEMARALGKDVMSLYESDTLMPRSWEAACPLPSFNARAMGGEMGGARQQ